MDAMTIASKNYSKVVSHCNKLSKVNQNLQKENKDLQAQKYHLWKALEKLKKDTVFRKNSKKIDSPTLLNQINNTISNFDKCGVSIIILKVSNTTVIYFII
jgi:hypothetical protein